MINPLFKYGRPRWSIRFSSMDGRDDQSAVQLLANRGGILQSGRFVVHRIERLCCFGSWASHPKRLQLLRQGGGGSCRPAQSSKNSTLGDWCSCVCTGTVGRRGIPTLGGKLQTTRLAPRDGALGQKSMHLSIISALPKVLSSGFRYMVTDLWGDWLWKHIDLPPEASSRGHFSKPGPESYPGIRYLIRRNHPISLRYCLS